MKAAWGGDDLSASKSRSLTFRKPLSRCGRPPLRAVWRSRLGSLCEDLLPLPDPVSNSRSSPRASARQSRTRHGLWARNSRNDTVQNVLLSQSRPARGRARHFRAALASNGLIFYALRNIRCAPLTAKFCQFV